MNQPDRESDLVWLSYIRECIAEVDEYTGNKRERFDESRMVRRAVERVLQTLAESTQRLSKGIKATEPGIPWEEISGFRNTMVHGYRHIDQEIMWDIIERDLPKLAPAIERMTERARTAEGRTRPAEPTQSRHNTAEKGSAESTAEDHATDGTPNDERGPAGQARTIHKGRARHPNPEVRADAQVALAALEAPPTPRDAAAWLAGVLDTDPEISDNPTATATLRKGAAGLAAPETRRQLREDAIAAAKTPSVRAEFREAIALKSRETGTDGKTQKERREGAGAPEKPRVD